MVLFTVFLARRLGEVGLGQYAFISAVIFVANVITSFGTDMLIVREIAARRDLTLLPTTLALQLGFSLACVTIIIIAAPTIPRQSPETVRALQIYSIALIPLAFYTVFSAALRGFEYMHLYMWLNLVTASLQAGLVWFVIQPGSSLLNLVWLLVGVQTAVAVLSAVFCLARIPGFHLLGRITSGGILKLLRASAPIAVLGLLGMLYQKLSIYMLATLDGAAATGWFSAAMRAVEASKIGHIALFGAMFPAMSQANTAPTQQARQWQNLFSFSWKLLLLLAGLASLALFSFAIVLVPLLYGPGFEPAIPVLRILAWMLIPYTINTYLTLALLSAGQERRIGVALLGSLLVLTLLNFAWIRPFGLVGACWAALLAECVHAGILILQRNK